MKPTFRVTVRVIHGGYKPVLRMCLTLHLPSDVDSDDARAVRSYVRRSIAQSYPPPYRVEIDRIERLPSREEP